LAAFVLLLGALSPVWSAEPWQALYTGEDATGPNVIGLWQFQPGAELKDSSGHGHDLTLRGQARVVTEGPLGGALESFPAGETNDKPQGAIAKDADDLSPAGAFTLEAWFMAKPEMDKSPNVFLLDKKYIHYVRDTPEANWDYGLTLARVGPNRRRLDASLGFGKDSDFIQGPELDVAPGTWIYVAFTYDGAGRSRFFVNGELKARAYIAGRGPVAPGNHPSPSATASGAPRPASPATWRRCASPMASFRTSRAG